MSRPPATEVTGRRLLLPFSDLLASGPAENMINWLKSSIKRESLDVLS
jgi:hypothetical protein